MIPFMKFLRFLKSGKFLADTQQTDGKKYRARGGLSNKVILDDDFNKIPECFKEYM